ncbi:hypothetical protein RZN05_11705 [Sphingomonas sp. HF-S4]|uniref:Lipoprotein n=1 Tax=Sphingomonas agrestis TaxID=3080540 RepID=A0ABU3Y8N1_9SPHN|nr:hypothetical protein [Sphingomonas sp. HF-S4]MDV3457652.1 hypothetical protein [Sphingomonas sp. HF-S4]
MRNTVMIVAALTLAGCGGDREPAPGNDTIAIPRNETVTTPARPVQPAPAASPAAVASPTPSPSATEDAGPIEARIPRTLRGRWGLVAADCKSVPGEHQGSLVVSGETLRFYESVGTLGTVVEKDDSRIVGDFIFEGEGTTWKRRVVLDGQDGGKTLVRREQGADAMPGALRYRRCA